jgi:glutathione S-transferase
MRDRRRRMPAALRACNRRCGPTDLRYRKPRGARLQGVEDWATIEGAVRPRRCARRCNACDVPPPSIVNLKGSSMKLYFARGTCALAPHIALAESGLPFEIESVDLGTKKTGGGLDYTTINPKGYVPALQLDNGEVLTEGPAIGQYVADLVPDKKLAPANGTLERYRLAEWLNFISTEIHKNFSGLFNPSMPAEAKDIARAALAKRIGYAAEKLQHSTYLTGNAFTIADAYLFTVLQWAKPMKIDLSPWPSIGSFLDRVAARPAVKAALEAQGAGKKA